MYTNDTRDLTIFVKKVVEDYLYATMALAMLVIISNLLVVISSVLLVRKGQEPRCMYILLGNISLSDLIIGVLSIFGLSYRPDITEDNVIVCIMFLGLYITCSFTSLLSILFIAIDRYFYIIYGLQYRRLLYPKKIKHMIIGAWLFGVLIGIGPLFIWHPHSSNIEICWYTIIAPPTLLLTTSLMGIFIVLTVIILYLHILYVAVKKVYQIRRMMNGEANHDIYSLRFFTGRKMTEQDISSDCDNNINRKPSSGTSTSSVENDRNSIIRTNSSNRVAPNKWKAVKVVLFITGSFAVTWMPYFITSIMLVLCDDESEHARCRRFKILVVSPTAVIAKVNSFLNPVIYAWWHTGFRKAFMKLFLNKM